MTITSPSIATRPRARRALLSLAVGAGLLGAVPAGSATAEAVSSRQPQVARGTGRVTGELPFCSSGAPGPCGWIIEGTTSGTPIASGSFFAIIDDGNAATDDRCEPATYLGVLSAGATDTITQTADGTVCPDLAGGFVFAGRVDSSAGTGRFSDVSAGTGFVVATMRADGAARLNIAGLLRIG